MPCKPLHAVHYLHSADLNSMHCSHITSWSIQLKPNSLGWHYALLHQSAYQQHLGLLLGTFINGSSLARSYRRHLRATQSSDPHWSATWTPSTLDWRPRIWDLEWNSGFGQSKSTVHYAHELPPGTSKPKHATVTHCRQKECPAGCILFLQAVFLSFSLFALLMFLLVFWLKSRSWLAGIDAPPCPNERPTTSFCHPTPTWKRRCFSSETASSSALAIWHEHTWTLLKDLMKQERMWKLVTSAIRRWSLLFLYHMDIHPTPKGKHIHYNRKCHKVIGCFTLTFSRR